jgi:hypothetical protein
MEKWEDTAAELKFTQGVSWTNLPMALKEKTGLDVSFNKIRSALRRHPLYKKPVILEDKKTYTETDVDEYIQQMLELQKKAKKLDTKQVKASVIIPDNKPVGIAHWGDWHLGCEGTDYESFLSDSEKIQKTEGLYFIGMGDYKDNYIQGAPKGGSFGQAFQPYMQDLLVQHEMGKVGDKAIALIRGCHDAWDYKESGKDFIETLCDITEAVNLWHGGELSIKLGDETYLWRARHKFKFQSALNVENAMRRIMETQGPCDVAAEAHYHNPYTLQRGLMGANRVMLRSGSYKMWDDFGQQIGGYVGQRGIPVVIIFPEEHKMIDIVNLDDAITVLNGLRK